MSYAMERSEYVKLNRAKFSHYNAKQRDKLKLEVVEAYGGKCVHCKIDNPIVLCLDHINDDAYVEIEEFGLNARGGHKNYARLKQQGWPKDRFQLLCYNCNAVKEHNRRRQIMIESRGKDAPADRRLVQAKIGMKSHNNSGFKGVYWNSNKHRWQAKITIDYKAYTLGQFLDIRDAAKVYRAKAIETWGDAAVVPTDEEIEQIARTVENPSEYPKLATATEMTAEELGL